MSDFPSPVSGALDPPVELHPAQRRALAYLHRRGRDAPFAETIERLGDAFVEIETLLDTLSEDAARRRVGEGWCAQEITDHLLASHAPALDQWRALVAGEDPGAPIAAGLLSKTPLGPSFRDTLARLRRLHAEWLDAVRSTDADTLDPAGREVAPVVMVVRDGDVEEPGAEGRVFEWIESVDAKSYALAVAVHTREHAAQARRLLEALAELSKADPGPRLASARLRLRPLAPSDVDAIHRLFDDPDVRRYLFDGERVPRETAAQIVATSRRQFASRGHGLWAVEREGYDHPVGFGGFWFFFDPPQLQLLYGLHPDVWGQGLATELAGRLLDHGFETLGFDAIVGATDPPNVASIRVMEKLGMERWREETRDGKDTVYFRIEHPEASARESHKVIHHSGLGFP